MRDDIEDARLEAEELVAVEEVVAAEKVDDAGELAAQTVADASISASTVDDEMTDPERRAAEKIDRARVMAAAKVEVAGEIAAAKVVQAGDLAARRVEEARQTAATKLLDVAAGAATQILRARALTIAYAAFVAGFVTLLLIVLLS